MSAICPGLPYSPLALPVRALLPGAKLLFPGKSLATAVLACWGAGDLASFLGMGLHAEDLR